MKELVISLFLLASLLSCGLKADSCDDTGCGHEVTIRQDIVLHNRLLERDVTLDGFAQYLWPSPEGFACTANDAKIRINVNLEEEFKIVETIVRLFVITGGQTDELPLTPIGHTTFTEFEETLEFRLFDATDACHASVRFHLMIEFQSLGNREKNDNYLKDVLGQNASVSIMFNQGLD